MFHNLAGDKLQDKREVKDNTRKHCRYSNPTGRYGESDASPATAGIITVTKTLEFRQESKVLPEGFPREPAGINSVTKKKDAVY